ncbi:MAG: hypothetical protein MZW92_52800 [Comamonadaceae bacterium]|nr:hypothetical protein [Comamonadaceae bacterium]
MAVSDIEVSDFGLHERAEREDGWHPDAHEHPGFPLSTEPEVDGEQERDKSSRQDEVVASSKHRSILPHAGAPPRRDSRPIVKRAPPLLDEANVLMFELRERITLHDHATLPVWSRIP